MRSTFGLLLLGLAAGCGRDHDPAAEDKQPAAGHAHQPGEGGHAGHATPTTMDIQPRDGVTAGSAAKLRFTIPGADGRPITAFAVAHDARVHLIVIRRGLDTFTHLHPEIDEATGVMSATYTFPAGGAYHLFADYQEPGGRPAVAAGRVEVGGDAPAARELTPDVPGLLTGDGITARVSVTGAKPGREAEVRFEVLEDAKPVADLEPYMGAMGHLVVVSADAGRYVHAHPDDKAEAKHVVTFRAVFPSAGVYKGWGQFKRSGQVRVVPFVARIN